MKSSPLASARIAFATLTALPIEVEWAPAAAREATGYYPFVGLVLGTFVALVELALLALGGSRVGPLVLSTLAVMMWAALSRMLHWDGLADLADGYFASTPERRLSIMRDSSIGAFGVTAVALVLALEVSALAGPIGRGQLLPLAAVPVFGRLAATFGAWFGAPARSGGLGAAVAGRPGIGAVVPALACLAFVAGVLVWMEPVAGIWVASVGVVFAAGVPHVLARRFGGVTGDVLGASVLLAEVATAVVVAWVW